MPEQPASLAAALVALQAELPVITKDDRAQAGNRETRYANLNTITEAIFPLLAKHRFYWTCVPTLREDDQFVLRYTLRHQPSDERISGDYPLGKGNPQQMGGAITYARRYALCAVLGIAPAEDDDDAQATSDRQEARQEARTRAIGDEFAAAPPPHFRPAQRHRGNPGDDEWTSNDAPGSITTKQRNKIMALYGEIGITDRDDRLRYAMVKLELPGLATSNDLRTPDGNLWMPPQLPRWRVLLL